MKKPRPLFRLALAAVALLAALSVPPAASASAAKANPEFDRWLDAFTLDWVRLQPTLATGKEYFSAEEQDRLDRDLTMPSEEFAQRLATFAQRGLDELAGFDRASLSPAQRVSASTLRWQLGQAVGDARFFNYFYPFNQIIGAQSGLLLYLDNAHLVRNVREAETYAARVEKIPRAIEAMIATTRRREETRGIRAPRAILEATIGQMERIIAPAPADFVLVTSLARRTAAMPDFPAADRERLVATVTGLVEAQVYPAYRRALALLRDQLTRAVPDAGLGQFRGGAEAYAWYLRKFTTTDYTPEQVHALGLEQVAAIEAEMDTLFRRLGFADGTIQQRYERLQAREQPPGTDDEGRAFMLAAYEKQIRYAEERAAEIFDLRPRAPVVVKRESPFTEATGAAHYTQPSKDGSVPGIFWATLPSRPFPVVSLRSLTYHEAVPGHHFQFALQLEQDDLPRFRRDAIFGFMTAYGEGWALYAEKLADEQGWYGDDLVGRIGYLASSLFRAKRLVVDTGLHAKGWTREQAIAYGMPRSEVERYMVWAGQACSYKIGELKILELRARAQRELGGKYSLKEFHNVVLRTGGVPLAVLEEVVDEWIAEKR